MPYRIRKLSGPRPYKIQRKKNGKWETVGSSTSRKKAESSKRIREKAEKR